MRLNRHFHPHKTSRPNRPNFKSYVVTIAVALSLAACGTAKPVGQTANSNWQPPKANFALFAATVSWRDNPSIPISIKYVVNRSNTDKSVPQAIADRSQGYIKTLLQVFKANVSNRLKAELSEKGVAPGKSYTVVVTPVSANFDDTGWGSGLLVRTDVVDSAARTVWSVTIETRSGLHWLGGVSAPPPDEMFVNNYVESLVKAMASSGMLNKQSTTTQ
jgi:hypothetical protein